MHAIRRVRSSLRRGVVCLAAGALFAIPSLVSAQESSAALFTDEDVFGLEWASDPQISPDGGRVVYVRNGYDVMTDRNRSALWMLNFDGSNHRALTSGDGNAFAPRWSPDGGRLAYVSTESGSPEVWLRWMDTGQTTLLTNLTRSPGSLTWSPDGQWLAFTMFVPGGDPPMTALMPDRPEGAEWAPPATVIERMQYRFDGAGYLPRGYTHIFVLPADGGTPRQVTSGDFNHGGSLSWSPDGDYIVFSANRGDPEFEPNDSEVFQIHVGTGEITALTDRYGPDSGPVVSPDGQYIAYTGYDDRYQGYQVTKLYVMDRDGSNPRLVSGDLDRDVGDLHWDRNSDGLYFQYDDEGNTRVAWIGLDGEVRNLARNLGGLSLGRPYGGGQLSASRSGRIAYTYSTPDHPADVAVVDRGGSGETRITRLNDDLLGHKELARVEMMWWESSFDGRPIQGWVAYPPGFDPAREYPMILEIHGGPFANYGDRFAAEVQLFAAAGYVVFYTNPRGSTSYGEEFGNLIHHNYPGQDYDDLMSGVDALIERIEEAGGAIDEDQLFVTGGSGGGVLTAWIVGNTDRFAAAVVAKPVINWASFVLTADNPVFFTRYWFPAAPWEDPDHYWKRSPLSLVGNVTTPTMLLTGEADYRTPMSETEQYYMGLKLNKVPSAMVRIPEASHGITARPSNLGMKVNYILEWFAKYRTRETERPATDL
jgi:dipeptidyl aminopeptidase/acylaminoacyl peptidase